MPIEIVSLTSTEGLADDDSFNPSLSDDARYVVFQSFATNLVSGDTNGNTDVFVRDLVSGTTTQVSVSSAEVGGNLDSVNAHISGNGQFVVFESFSTNLVGDDTNGSYDIFIRDLVNGTTARVSVDTLGLDGNADSYDPDVSETGRYVAFHSMASDLVGGDINAVWDVFVRDRQSGTTQRASVSSAGAEGNGASSNASVSADGNLVVFQSLATTLVGGDGNGAGDIFVRDLGAATTTRVSLADDGSEANGGSYDADIAGAGRYVVFTSDASNLVGSGNDTNGVADVFVRDTQLGTTERISVATGGTQANGASGGASISADGRYVTFHSTASNLVGGDTNSVSDVFVHDRVTGATTRLSVNGTGTQGNGSSEGSAITADGQTVVLASMSSNFVVGDTNNAMDVFITDNSLINDPPVITGGATASVNVAEGSTAVTNVQSTDDHDSEGAGLAYSLVAGQDSAFFDIDAATGVVTFKVAPDYETPQDSNLDNVYVVTVHVTDSGLLTDTQEISVTVTDVAGVTINGTSGDDRIDATHTPAGQPYPGAGEDTIYGYDGDDTLDGAGGADSLIGGAGNDIYYVDDPGDVITEGVGESTNDALRASYSFVVTSAHDGIEWIGLVGSDALTLTGNDAGNRLTDNSGNNIVWGLGGDDEIWSDEGDDTLYGGSGNDTLHAQGGTDDLYGGTEDDFYVIRDSLSTVNELFDEGQDEVWAFVDYVLPTNVEDLQLGPLVVEGVGNELGNVISGFEADNVLAGLGGDDVLWGDGTGGTSNDSLLGGDGADTLYGGDGNDFAVYVDDTAGVTVDLSLGSAAQVSAGEANGDRLYDIENLAGGSGDDHLTGDGGDNILSGEAGNDTLAGGLGNDILVVDTAGDVLIEVGGQGTDTVASFVTSLSLASYANIENAAVLGSLDLDLTGDAGDNRLIGNDGANVLEGGAGADTLEGGLGNDTYVLADGTDSISDTGGHDTVTASLTVSLATYAEVEDLVLDGAGDIDGTGNDLDNTITGNGGANLLDGGAGNDTLAGGGGNDTIDGGSGADSLEGGLGDDTYVLSDGSDTVSDIGGNDGITSTITRSLASYLGIENLVLIGLSNINATGDAADNRLTGNDGDNVLDGGGGTDTLEGGLGNDTFVLGDGSDIVSDAGGHDTITTTITRSIAGNLDIEDLVLAGTDAIGGTGNTLDNALTGNSSANVLDGGLGIDTMAGGLGDDTYIVETAATRSSKAPHPAAPTPSSRR